MPRRRGPRAGQYVVEKTVLILGAGASKPYGFPLGSELRDAICGMTTAEDMGLFADLDFHYRELDEFVLTLRTSGYSSVDWFLEVRPEFATIGKAAIARCLIPFEEGGRLFPPKAPKEHWYELLLNQLDGFLPLGEMGDRGVSILTFNYDRSLEHYLFKVLSTRRKSESRAAAELARLPIIHLHGSLGAYPALESTGRPYHPQLTAEQVDLARRGIVVIGEADKSTPEFSRAREIIANADRVLFLGFGYQRMSLARLGLDAPSDHSRQVSGTTWHVPAPTWDFIRQYVFTPPSRKRNAQSVYKFIFEGGGVTPSLVRP